MIRHTFISPKADGVDTSLVRPSNWNADHTIDDVVGLQALLSIQTGAISGVTFSAGTQSAGLPSVVFSNTNGVSFGLDGSTITASAANGSVNVSAGAISQNLTNFVFSNSNGLSFGLNVSTITGSYTVPGATSFANSNGISFGLNASTITASYTVPAATVFSNSNNVTFGLAGSTITASVGSSLTAIKLSAGVNSANLSAVTFSNSNGVSFGLNASTMTASVAAQSAQTQSNIAGLYDGANSISAGTARFSNSNGISFGINGQTITASHNGLTTQTNQQMTLFATGNTTQSSTGTTNASSLIFNGQGNVSVGVSNGSVVISGGTAAAAPVNVSAGTTSGNLNTVVFSNSNGISFGLNGSTITASHATSLTAINVSAGTTSNNLSAVVFSNSNNLTFGLNGSTVTGSASQSVQAGSITVTGNTAANSTGTWGNALVVNASTNITAWMSNGSLVLSGGAGGGGSGTASLFALGNTTQNSSTSLDIRSLSFNGLGAMSWGYSNGSIQVSAPASSSLSATGAVSISTNGSTISIGVPNPILSDWINFNLITLSPTAQANSSVSVFPIWIPDQLAFSQVRLAMSISAASAANTSSASQAISGTIVLYSRNSGTLSSLWSGGYNTNTFWQSNSTSVFAGNRAIDLTGVATTLQPDHYWAAVHVSTTNTGTGGATTALGASISMIVPIPQATAVLNLDHYTQGASNASRVQFPGMGILSTGASRATLALSDANLSQGGVSGSRANLLLNFRNWSLF